MITASAELTAAIARARQLERAGHVGEARGEYERVLPMVNEDSDVTCAALLRWIGGTYRAEGRMAAAREQYQVSLAAAEASGSATDAAHALNWIGIVEYEMGAMDAAVTYYNRARKLAFRARDHRLLALVRQNLGTALYVQGDIARALRHFTRSLQCYRTLGDEEAASRALNNLGLVQSELALWHEADESFTEAARICERTADLQTRVMIEVNRVDLAVRRGDLRQALRLCDRARLLAHQIEHQPALGEIYKWYGIIYRERKKPALAQSHLEAALDQARRYSNLLLEGEVHRELGVLFGRENQNRAALESLNHAHRIFTEMHARRMLNDIDAQLNRLEGIFLKVVEQWGDSIERKDNYTRGHCQRVAEYSCAIARAAGFDQQSLTWFRMGAFLHDVGKTAIPADILNKRAPLSPAEWNIMRTHPALGEELLSGLHFPWDIRPIVRSHHERWDGTGYPDGLKGEEIPLAARILAIADAYDALTTNRAYRVACAPEVAVERLRRDVGSAFDPALFVLFENELQKLAAGGDLAEQGDQATKRLG